MRGLKRKNIFANTKVKFMHISFWLVDHAPIFSRPDLGYANKKELYDKII